jgi:recombinational DNA repair protein RecT
MNSGEDDPGFKLVNDEDRKHLRKLLELVTEPIDEPKIHLKMGYRGIFIKLDNRTVKIYVTGHIVIYENKTTTYYRDTCHLELEILKLTLRLNPASLSAFELQELKNRVEALEKKSKEKSAP